MSDFLNGMNSVNSHYTDHYSEATESLRNDLKNKDFATATDEELMEACKSFEQYLVEQAMKGMEKMIPKDEDKSSGTSYVETFKDTLYQEYAALASEQPNGTSGKTGIGIAQMMYEAMKRNYAVLSDTEMAENAASVHAPDAEE